VSESIPGFTDEQAWALRTVARQAAEETVAKLAERPCGFDCGDMADVKATVYGNGSSGLKTRVTRLEEQLEDVLWLKRASLVAAFGAVGSLVVSLWK
jgi:hypothetical protein